MKWSRDTYAMVANIVGDADLSEHSRAQLAQAFADAFTEDNPRFDRRRWYADVDVDPDYVMAAQR